MIRIVVLIFSLFQGLNVSAQVTCTAIANGGSGYSALLNADFAIETPDCEHTDFGAHVTQTYDAELNANVFVFHSHIDADNDRCQVFDRVRTEIKGGPNTSLELQHSENSVSFYRWKFRLSEDFIGASSFNHIFQNKAKGGEDDGFPILTITVRENKLEIRHNGGDTGADAGVLAEADLSLFKGKWTEGYLHQTHSENGDLEIILRDLMTGDILLEHTETNIDLWRTDADYNRPKWGMYRLKNTVLQDETIRFADFCISESDGTLCPVAALISSNTTAFLEEEIQIFPNPTQQQLHIVLGENQEGRVSIYNVEGKEIKSDIFIKDEGIINLTDIKNGTYLVKVTLQNGRISTEKIIINR